MAVNVNRGYTLQCKCGGKAWGELLVLDAKGHKLQGATGWEQGGFAFLIRFGWVLIRHRARSLRVGFRGFTDTSQAR